MFLSHLPVVFLSEPGTAGWRTSTQQRGNTTGKEPQRARTRTNNGRETTGKCHIYIFLFERIKIFIPLCFLSEKYSHILVYFTTFSKFVSIAKVCNNALKQSSGKKTPNKHASVPCSAGANQPITSFKQNSCSYHDLGTAHYFLMPYILAKLV